MENINRNNAINFQLFIFETGEDQVVFSPLFPTVCGKGATVRDALAMWQMQQGGQATYNFDFLDEEDLNASRKVWYGRSEDGGVYIVDDVVSDRGVAFCPRTGRAESFRWTRFRNHVRHGSASPLSFSLVSGLFDERVRCSLLQPVYPQNYHGSWHSLTPHHMN
jgi:hypothetical protein